MTTATLQKSNARTALIMAVHTGDRLPLARVCPDLPTGLGSPRTADADPTKVSPPLVGNTIIQAHDPATLINTILYGAHEDVLDDKSWPKMPGFELDFGLGMDDEQVAALATYVRNSWGNKGPAVDAKDVAKQR